MILTTTPTLQDKDIREYQGLVTAEAIYGAHIGRDILAGLRDFFGGRSATYERVVMEGKVEVAKELEERALAMNANAVVGINYEFEVIGAKGSMLMISMSGTAVRV